MKNMVNINKNNLCALSCNSGNFAQSDSLADYRFSADKDFTFQIAFCTKVIHNSIIFSQASAFEFGIANASIYFHVPGFLSMDLNSNILPIKANVISYIAITYNATNKIVSVYYQGQKIHETTASGIGSVSKERYEIGKTLNGYVTDIRLFESCIAVEEIIKDGFSPLTLRDNCLFWLSFRENQPIDNGPNKLSIWLIEKGRVINLVPCTYFGKSSCCVVDNVHSQGDSYSLLCKFYANRTNTSMYLYSDSLSQGDLGFALYLKISEVGKYSLSFVSGDTEITSDVLILSNRWTDVAMVRNNTTITLYIDGVAVKTGIAPQAVSASKMAYIGARTINNKPDFTTSFQGYMDYMAEFNKAIPANDIEKYVDNRPFIYADEIISLYQFSQSSLINAIGLAPIYRTGNIDYLFAEQTNPLGTPSGVHYYYPTEANPLWDTLTSYQQWKWQMYFGVQYASELFFTGKQDPNPEETITDRSKKQFVGMAASLGIEYANAPDITAGLGLATVSIVTAVGLMLVPMETLEEALGGAGAGLCGGLCGGGAAGGGACTCANWLTWVVGGAIIVVIGIIIFIALKKPAPDPEVNPKKLVGKFKITSLRFINSGDSSIGSLYYRKNHINAPDSILFPVDSISGQINACCIMVPNNFNNPYLIAHVKLNTTKEEYPKLTTKIFGSVFTKDGNTQDSFFFGSFSSDDFSIESQEEKDIVVKFSINQNVKSDELHTYTDTISWEFENPALNQKEFFVNSNQKTYVLPKSLVPPWDNKININYDKNNTAYIWTDLLDGILNVSKSPINIKDDDTVLSLLSEMLNKNMKLSYVCDSQFTAPDKGVKLQKFVQLLISQQSGTVNGEDCANLLAVMSAAFGITIYVGTMQSKDGLFCCNPVIPIGAKDWRTEGLSSHSIALKAALADKETCIYDACFQIDNGDSPTKVNSGDKIPKIPQNISFSETSSPVVAVIQLPYKGNFYRERLVMAGYHCFLSTSIYRPQVFTDDKT